MGTELLFVVADEITQRAHHCLVPHGAQTPVVFGAVNLGYSFV